MCTVSLNKQLKMDNAVQEKLLHVTTEIEKQVDATIEKLDSLDTKDLEQLRKTRIKELKEREEKKKIWLDLGHGTYEQLAEEKMFFDVVKKSENCAVHFFTNTSSRSPILEMHLKKLAPKHLETRFVAMDAEKCPFLAEKLRIKTIPTLVLVKNGTMIDKIVGFTQLGNRDDFTTEMLEWRIAHSGVIEYEGDLSTPPHLQEKPIKKSGRKIRDGAFNNDEDDLEDLNTLDGVSYDIPRSGVKCSAAEPFLTPEEAKELGLDDE